MTKWRKYMTYYYDADILEEYGKDPERYWNDGTYIMTDGKLFDVDNYASIAHAAGFVIPFFRAYMHPDEETLWYYKKEEMLENLLGWKEALLTRTYDVNPKEQQMRLALVKYFINVYKSKNTVWDYRKGYADLSKTTGIPNIEENWQGRDVTLKSVLVQACNHDAIESARYRTITTSKFNIYETFYDYILHDWEIFQIPKKVYDENLEQYIDWKQEEWFISDKELRLKDELTSICREVPLEERHQYCRNKEKIKRFDFLD